MNKLIISSLALAALSLAACGENNNPVANIREATTDTSLQAKNFASKCSVQPVGAVLTGILTGGDASMKSAKTVYRFTGANVERRTQIYQSADCSGDSAATFTEAGDFEIKEENKTSDNGKFIDIHFTKLKVKVNSDAGAEAAKALNLCGINSWSKDQESEVTAKAADANCYGTKVPRDVANVYRVDGSQLFLGTETKGNVAPNSRPSSLDMGVAYSEEK